MEQIIENQNGIIATMSNKKKSKYDNRVGETRMNSFGGKMTIIEYIDSSHVVVQFDRGFKEGWITTTQYANFKAGRVKNLYAPTVYFAGCIGEGKYKPNDGHGHPSKQYETWRHMLERCYSPYYQKRKPTYHNCFVFMEWCTFQNFAEWFDENYYEVEGETMCLDKDILISGNKLYQPDRCIFVPNKINVLFTKYNKNNKEHIKEVAEEYKGKIPEKLYDAMLNYNQI